MKSGVVAAAAFAIGLALGVAFADRGAAPEPAVVQSSSIAGVVSGIIRQYIADTSARAAQRDSLLRELQAANTAKVAADRKLALADSAAARARRRITELLADVPRPVREALAPAVDTLAAAGPACHLSLTACERQVASLAALNLSTEAQLAQTRRRALTIIVAETGLLLALLLGR